MQLEDQADVAAPVAGNVFLRGQVDAPDPVIPATGLKSSQLVRVQASGFAAGESLVVTECASKGTATGPGGCNLNAMQGVTADASGRVQVDFTVTKGPFGANNIVCGPAQACLISVTQAAPSPTREADAPIKFGLRGPE